MGFRSGEFAAQSSTPTPWSFNQLFHDIVIFLDAPVYIYIYIYILRLLVSLNFTELLTFKLQ